MYLDLSPSPFIFKVDPSEWGLGSISISKISPFRNILPQMS